MKRASLDFSPFFLTVVIIILASATIGSLAHIYSTQKITIGEKYKSVTNTYEQARALEFTLHESARASARLAISKLNEESGIASADCGVTGSFIHWNSPNQSCAPEHVHARYYALLNGEMRKELLTLEQSTKKTFSNLGYEYYADDARIVGIPTTVLPLPIQEDGDPIDVTLAGFTVERIEGGVRANIGWYYWRPTFDLSEDAGLSDYSALYEVYNAILDECRFLNSTEQHACVTHQVTVAGLSDAQLRIGEDGYYFITLPSSSTFSDVAPIRIGIYVENYQSEALIT